MSVLHTMRRMALLAGCLSSIAGLAQLAPQVKLDTAGAAPRAVEARTEEIVLRDYTSAWKNLASAHEQNSTQFFEGSFVGTARSVLDAEIADQKKTGIRLLYTGQKHSVKVAFYAPEGDVMELQDTVEYQIQVIEGEKVIQQGPGTLHYVVLMTPAADRWVVRQLQAVQRF